MPAKTRHTVRYVAASDGVRLAWAESGSGVPLVKAATWLPHLEHDLDSPVWRHWPAFRQVFTSRFIAEGTDEQLRWFNDLCRTTTSPELAGTLLRARADMDVTDLLRDIRTPTLVLHARNDAIAPLSEGRVLASEIP